MRIKRRVPISRRNCSVNRSGSVIDCGDSGSLGYDTEPACKCQAPRLACQANYKFFPRQNGTFGIVVHALFLFPFFPHGGLTPIFLCLVYACTARHTLVKQMSRKK
jgi:hypothetical protein